MKAKLKGWDIFPGVEFTTPGGALDKPLQVLAIDVIA